MASSKSTPFLFLMVYFPFKTQGQGGRTSRKDLLCQCSNKHAIAIKRRQKPKLSQHFARGEHLSFAKCIGLCCSIQARCTQVSPSSGGRQFWKDLLKQPRINEHSISEKHVIYFITIIPIFNFIPETPIYSIVPLLDSSKEPVADAEPCSMSFDPNGTYYRQLQGKLGYSSVPFVFEIRSLPG